jgi:hypothetical protein
MNMVYSCAVWTVKLFGVDLQYNIYCNTLVNGDETGEQTSALNLHFMHDDKRTHEYPLKLDKFLLFEHYVGHLCCVWCIYDIFETQHKNEITIQVWNCRNAPGIRNIDCCRTKQKIVWFTLNIACFWDPLTGLGVSAAARLTIKETNRLTTCSCVYSEANSLSACQEISRALRKTQVHYSLHKSPPLVPILRSDRSDSTPRIWLNGMHKDSFSDSVIATDVYRSVYWAPKVVIPHNFNFMCYFEYLSFYTSNSSCYPSIWSIFSTLHLVMVGGLPKP